jgi:AbrB family looped-hinge helix DNA binding protein
MKENKPAGVLVRPKRQVTLPKAVCDQMGITEGDELEVTVENCTLIARPRKKVALQALREIQRAFETSGVTEPELLDAGKKTRLDLSRERYGAGK